MRGEIPQEGFEEMHRREFTGEMPSNEPVEALKLSKNMEAGLNLTEKKFPGNVLEAKEQMADKGGQEKLSDRIRQELRVLPKIDSKNYGEVAKQVADKLGIKSKEDMDLLEAKVGVRRNIYQNLERIKMMDKEGQQKVYREFALEDSKWMQKVGDCIKNIKEDKNIPVEEKTKKIDGVWREMKEIYNDYGTYFEDFKPVEGRGVGNFEGNKNGILGQIAAEGLFKKAGVAFKELGVTDIKIETATPEEDVDKKTDFYVIVEFGKNSSMVFPCQVKSHAFDARSGNFIANNLVVRVSEDYKEGLKISAKDTNPSNCEIRTIEEVEIFRKKVLREFKEGFFVIIPRGKAEVGERKKEKVDLLENNGEVYETIRKGFLKQLAKKMFGIDNFEEPGIISKQKNKTKKGGTR